MEKFDCRNIIKQQLHSHVRKIFLKEREIRLVHLWKNICYEEDGKWKDFVRPVLILKKLGNMFFCVPMTTGWKNSRAIQFYYDLPLHYFQKESRLLLSQVRTLDKNRFIKKIGKIQKVDFSDIKRKLKALLL